MLYIFYFLYYDAIIIVFFLNEITSDIKDAFQTRGNDYLDEISSPLPQRMDVYVRPK